MLHPAETGPATPDLSASDRSPAGGPETTAPGAAASPDGPSAPSSTPAPPASAGAGGFALDRVYAEVTGPEDAPPLLVMHGWGSSVWMMRPVAAALADRFRVHALDMPGHGRTPVPPSGWGVPECAALVAAYVRENGLDRHGPIPAIGHSNGGRILLTMAADADMAPLFSHLVLVSPSGIRRTPTPRVRLKRLAASTLRAPFDRLPEGPLKAAGLDWLRHTLVWRALGSSDYNTLPPTMRETFVRTVGHDVEDRLGRIRIPVLVFWGDRDADVVREQMDRLVGGLPDAGLVVMEGAGHYGYLDRMDVFEAGTRHFLLGPDADAPAEASSSGSVPPEVALQAVAPHAVAPPEVVLQAAAPHEPVAAAAPGDGAAGDAPPGDAPPGDGPRA